jgi:hypothetical protein
MSLGTGIAIAGMWLAVTVISCTALIRADSEWVPYVVLGALFVAWFHTDNILEAGRRDDRGEQDGEGKESSQAN